MAQIAFTISVAQYQGKLVKALNMAIFVVHIFDGEECRVYNDKKINYVQTKAVLEDEEFQRSIYSVSYIRKLIDNIETPSLPDSQWLLTQQEEQEIKGIFISQTDEDLKDHLIYDHWTESVG